MDILDFIDSRDVREHARKVGYEQNSLDAALIVAGSKNHTIPEKRAAWRYIIDTMPDCEVRGTDLDRPRPSLHEFLEKYMEIEDAMIATFYNNDPGAVYSYRIFFDYGMDKYESHSLFATFDEAFEDAMEGESSPPNYIEVEKRYIGARGKSITVRMTPDKEPVSLSEEFFFNDTDLDPDIFYDVFFYLYPNLPNPFVKGDVLSVAGAKYRSPNARPVSGFVMDKEENIGISGYVFEDGVVNCERVYDISDLEYTDPDDLEIEGVLYAISKYFKGEIDLSQLLGACRVETVRYIENETDVALGGMLSLLNLR